MPAPRISDPTRPGGRVRVAARSLEQGDDPVAEHDRETERSHVEEAEAVQAPVCEAEARGPPRRGRSSGRSPLRAGAVAVGRPEQQHERARHSDDEGAPVGRPPIERAGELRNDGERDTSRAERYAAVEALRERRPAVRANVIDAGRRSRAPCRRRPAHGRRARAQGQQRSGAAHWLARGLRARRSRCAAHRTRSTARPAGIWSAACSTNSAVVKRPTVASATP